MGGSKGVEEGKYEANKAQFWLFNGSFLHGKTHACAGPHAFCCPQHFCRADICNVLVQNRVCLISKGQEKLLLQCCAAGPQVGNEGKLRLRGNRRAQICLDARGACGKAWRIQSYFSGVPSALRSATHSSSLFSYSSIATGSNCYFATEEKAARNEAALRG